MKSSIRILLVALSLLTGVLHLHAQNNVVTYQGRVMSGSTNFTGSGQFKFALVTSTDNLSYTTYWSNDGSSTAGSEPAEAVTVPVSGGLFTARLGDTALANMTALGAGLFQQPNLQLRIWFDDGMNGFAVLNPKQPLTASPYALVAVSASNLLGALPASQLSGVLPSAQFAGTYDNAVAFRSGDNTFSGDGTGLTGLNAANIASGTLSLARLPGNVITNYASGMTLNGTFNGNGTGLTNISLVGNSAGFILARSDYVLSSSLSVGLNPHSVVAADVNGDGWMDLISANASSQTLSVLTNNGSGGFLLSSSPLVGTGPFSLVVADVNGDGRMDLISTDWIANTLTVLWNAVNFTGNLLGGNVTATSVAVNGNATISQNSFLEFGFGTPGKEVNAGKIGYQLFSPDALDIVGAGTLNRKTKFWCEAGAVFTGTITQPSDRKLKQDFEPLDGRAVLEKVTALPIQTWAYKFEHGQRHIGPVAQDFHAVFGLNGADDEHIATVDADGVVLAAIQGLNQKVDDQEVELKQKQTEITGLKARLERLEQRLIQRDRGVKRNPPNL